MNTEALLDRLTRAVNDDAAIRRVRRLQPAGGPGDKLFPPTYPAERKGDPPKHVFERRRINGENVLCVLVDSVQSQANRLEESLKRAREAGAVAFPVISVDFAGTEVEDVGAISTLDAPHRIFDAIIRDSTTHEGLRFRESEHGKRLIEAKTSNARAVYELSPTALVFGAWNSTGQGGGLGAKFPRVLISELIGVGVATEGTGDAEKPSGQRTGSRIDPLGIRSGVQVFKLADGDWSLEPPSAGAKKGKGEAKPLKPSEINHSNIRPTVEPLGVSVDHVQHTFVLSLAGLRRLQFGSPEADTAGRTVLAALGLLAAVEQDRMGYPLRSRCDLVAEAGSQATFELILADGTSQSFSLGHQEAAALLKVAVAQAEKLGLRWNEGDLKLQPRPELVKLVVKSREQALEGVAGDEDEGGAK